MQAVVWDASMETGDALVDEQHRGLVALFNELLRTEERDAARIPEVLERLSEYVVVHFTAEEALMKSHDYPRIAAEAHELEHRALRARTRDLILEYRTGALATVHPLVDFMSAWLSEHIAQSDRRLVEHVHGTAESTSGAPADAS